MGHQKIASVPFKREQAFFFAPRAALWYNRGKASGGARHGFSLWRAGDGIPQGAGQAPGGGHRARGLRRARRGPGPFFRRRPPHRRPTGVHARAGRHLGADAGGAGRGQRPRGGGAGRGNAAGPGHDLPQGGVHTGICPPRADGRVRPRSRAADGRRAGDRRPHVAARRGRVDYTYIYSCCSAFSGRTCSATTTSPFAAACACSIATGRSTARASSATAAAIRPAAAWPASTSGPWPAEPSRA